MGEQQDCFPKPEEDASGCTIVLSYWQMRSTSLKARKRMESWLDPFWKYRIFSDRRDELSASGAESEEELKPHLMK